MVLLVSLINFFWVDRNSVSRFETHYSLKVPLDFFSTLYVGEVLGG